VDLVTCVNSVMPPQKLHGIMNIIYEEILIKENVIYDGMMILV